jgi:hypothetical protein
MRTKISDRILVSTRDNAILYEYNFSEKSPGFVKPPDDLIYTCSSSDRTVQTDDSQVVSGGPANYLPIGKLVGNSRYGLAFDTQITNQIVGVIGGTGWSFINASGISTVAFDTIGPDGKLCKYLMDDSTTGLAEGAYRAGRIAQTTDFTRYFSCWFKLISGNYTGNNAANIQVFSDSGSTGPCFFTPNSNWTRFFGSHTSSNLGQTNRPQFSPSLGIDAQSSYTGEVGFYGCMYPSINTKILTEYYDGTLSGSGLGLSYTKCIYDGRLNLEIEWAPRNANTDYGLIYLFYMDSNNYCSYNGSTGLINCVINGVSFAPNNVISWSAPTSVQQSGSNLGRTRGFYLTGQRVIKFFISTGGSLLNTQIQIKIDSGANTVINSNSPQSSISYSGNVGIGSNLSDLTTGQMSGHILKIKTYKTGYKPDWCS